MNTPWTIAIIALWACLLVLAAVVLGMLTRLLPLLEEARSAHAHRGPDAVQGRRLAEFTATGPDGVVVTSAQVARDAAASGGGGFVLLFLSASCVPCRRLLDALELHRFPGQGVPVHAVIDPFGLAAPGLPKCLSPLFEARGSVARVVGVRATPTALAVAADGIVVRSIVPTAPSDLDALVVAVQAPQAAPIPEPAL